MLILAVESSAKPVSVAVYEISDNADINASGNNADGKIKVSKASDKETVSNANDKGKLLGLYFQNNGFSHSRSLLPMMESLLKNLELTPSDIGLVAVASGPGSFTGIRIGVSAAKGFAWGLDIPVCGVSTLEAMAKQTPADGVIICPVMDARREQVYNAIFKSVDGNITRLCDDRAISISDLAADLCTYDLPCLLVGDGAVLCAEGISRLEGLSLPEIRIAPEPARYQTAHGVALAAIDKTPVSAAELEPFYLRPSQAERERSQSSSSSSS